MRLSDIMAHADLAIFPEIAMVIFLAVFVLAMARLARRPRAEIERLSRMPLDDDPPGHAVRAERE